MDAVVLPCPWVLFCVFCRGLYAAQFITSSSRCPIGLRVEGISANVAAIQSG